MKYIASFRVINQDDPSRSALIEKETFHHGAPPYQPGHHYEFKEGLFFLIKYCVWEAPTPENLHDNARHVRYMLEPLRFT